MQNLYSPIRTAATTLLLILCVSLAGFGQRGRRPQQNSRAAANNRSTASSRVTAATRRNERGGRNADRRGRDEERGANSRTARNETARDRRGRENRREIAARQRREREEAAREAARRAEAARQARLAAIARQRSADQALRNETTANILRDDTTGEDLQVRQAAISALAGHAGTVVVMNPQTGQVYTVVNQDWGIRRGWKPCSTIKLVTGLAGISEGVIGASETVQTSSGANFRLGLTDSLAYSNNTYFQMVGGRVGFDRMMSYARQLGLGERTGINHANESPGRLPLIMTNNAVYRMSSHGDEIEVTPIQLATMVSAIANGGNLLTPHLPRSPQETVRFRTEVRRRLTIPQDVLRRVVPGMIGAVNYGTARGAYDITQTIAGKTGTCICEGSWIGLFASYAPVHDPRLAVVVVTRGSSERGRIAASIAGRIFRSLNSRFGTQGTGNLANAPVVAPRPQVDPRTAAAISDEEREANEGTGSFSTTGVPPVREPVRTLQTAPPTRSTETSIRPVPRTNQSQSSGSSSQPSSQPSPTRPRRVLMTSP